MTLPDFHQHIGLYNIPVYTQVYNYILAKTRMGEKHYGKGKGSETLKKKKKKKKKIVTRNGRFGNSP